MREIRIRDTLSGMPRPILPREGQPVRIYACGPTVYSRIHVGNARPYVVFSLLKRFLLHEGLGAMLVINVTDINDKIYAAARERGGSSSEHAAEMTRLYFEDTDRLGLGRPDAEPLATETVGEIIALIEELVAAGSAYESGGDVYFRVRSFPGYGKLSNRDPAEMDQGEEAGSASLKEDSLDFALWKAQKPGEDTSWDSPWGSGRPGWHIECSAMAEKLLGVDFEIHGGGSDLVFPHHENEIAQTEAARGTPLARVWMHNGMVLTGPEAKMAKSEGNVFLLHEAVERFGAEPVVDFLISGHYRQPIAFDEEALERAQARNERVRDFFRGAVREDGDPDPQVARLRDAFLDALADDFNTPRAMAELYDLITAAHKTTLRGAHAVAEELLEIVGLRTLAGIDAIPDPAAEQLLAERERARVDRDFERADRLRDELAARGWEVRDTAEGPRLRRR